MPILLNHRRNLYGLYGMQCQIFIDCLISYKYLKGPSYIACVEYPAVANVVTELLELNVDEWIPRSHTRYRRLGHHRTLSMAHPARSRQSRFSGVPFSFLLLSLAVMFNVKLESGRFSKKQAAQHKRSWQRGAQNSHKDCLRHWNLPRAPSRRLLEGSPYPVGIIKTIQILNRIKRQNHRAYIFVRVVADFLS